MYGGSFSTQGGMTDSGTISGAGTIGGPISGSGTIYAEQGTLDLTGTVTSGLTFEIASYGDLKIDGTATVAPLANLVAVNQVLEIGPSGSLTFTSEGGGTGGTIELDGGTFTDAQGFSSGNLLTITGFGTLNGTEYGAGYERGATIDAVGGTLTLNGDIYSGVVPEVAETTRERWSVVLPKRTSSPRLRSPGASVGACSGVRTQYANEPVAAPEFRTDEIALHAQCFAQGGDLNLEILLRHNNARPHASEKLFLCDERAVGLQQDQKEVEGASAQFDWNTVGKQPSPAKLYAEASEFDCCVGPYRTPPSSVMR